MPRKPKLGQNFLIDAAAQQRIADALGPISASTVLEIGPGHGAITDILAPRAHRLIALELDRSLAAELRFRFRNQPSVEILEADVLTTDLAALLPPASSDKLEVIGNLPYYITSDILLKLFANASRITTAVLMMQREVASRVAASPGTKDFGLLAATAQMYAQIENLFTLPPAAFNPPPDVHSSVVRLTFAPRFAELAVEPKPFDKFLHQVFSQKRKTLNNNLRAAGYSTEQLANLWPKEIPQLARAESLTLEQLALMHKALPTP